MDADIYSFLTNCGVPTLMCLVLLRQNKDYVKAIKYLSVRVRKLEKKIDMLINGGDGYEEED